MRPGRENRGDATGRPTLRSNFGVPSSPFSRPGSASGVRPGWIPRARPSPNPSPFFGDAHAGKSRRVSQRSPLDEGICAFAPRHTPFALAMVRLLLAAVAMPSKPLPKTDPNALAPDDARAEHDALGREIAEHDRRYYEEDAPTVSDAEYDALRQRYEALEARFPELRTSREPDPKGRRQGLGEIRQGAPSRADAVARQRLRRGGRARVRRAHPALPRLRPGGAARLHGRAEDRRPVAEPAL